MITVVVASYRYGHLASHCIESLLSQTRPPDHIIFGDDGVGDCNHLPKLYPNIEYVLREKNLGTVKNFQDLLMRVKTDKCLFLGADNWLRSDALEALDQPNTDIVTYDWTVTGELRDSFTSKLFNNDRTPYQGDWYVKRNGLHHGSMLYNTQLAQQLGYDQNPNKRNPEEDLVLWDRMIKAGATVTYIPEGFLYYRRHKENFIKF